MADTSEYRWILVDDRGDPVSPRSSFPDEETALRFAYPGQHPRRMRVAGRSGPFSDYLEPEEETAAPDVKGSEA